MRKALGIYWILIALSGCSGVVDLRHEKASFASETSFDACLGIKEWTPSQVPFGSNLNSVVAVPRAGANDLIFGGSAGSRNFLFKVRVEGGGDPAFGNQGLAELPSFSTPTQIGSLSLDWKGRLVALPTNLNGKLFRTDTVTGTLDSSFGQGGTVSNLFPSGETNSLYSKVLSLAKAKKYLVAGYVGNYPNLHPVIVRLNENGSLDTSFGSGGFYHPALSLSNARISALGVDSTERIVFAGFGTDGSGVFRGYVARALENGSELDAGFNSGNALYLSENQHAWDLKVLENGEVLIGGAYANPQGTLIGKLTATGSWAPGFGQNGKLNINPLFSKPTVMNIHLDSAGNIFLASLIGSMIDTRKLLSNGDENAGYAGASVPTSFAFGSIGSFFSNNGIASVLLNQAGRNRLIVGAPKSGKATIWCVNPDLPLSQFE